MADVELVLRFFAYRQIDKFSGGLNRINSVLDSFLERGNDFPEQVLSEYERLFEGACRLLLDALGERALCHKEKGQPQKIIYDPLMLIASAYVGSEDEQRLRRRHERLREQVQLKLKQEPFHGRRTNSADVKTRNKLIADAFGSALS